MNGSSDIILKLFDTLKDSTDKNERTMQVLINQQQTLVDNVTHLPINEIRQEIKDHISSAQKERKDIENKVDKVDSKVTKMIIVVLVAFTIITGGYTLIAHDSDHAKQEQVQVQQKP
jgi:cation transport ATPase